MLDDAIYNIVYKVIRKEIYMYQEDFSKRLVELRLEKGVSAREMSLSIGQNVNYINRIENNKALPSMQGFFYICEYLEITPRDFFDIDIKYPEKYTEFLEDVKQLKKEDFQALTVLAKTLSKK